MVEINRENYRNINVDDIALDRNRLGTLVFEKATTYLSKLKDFFVELEDLGYREMLTPPEINDIENQTNTFVEYLRRVSSFDINQPNPGDVRNQLEAEIENFYNETMRVTRPHLAFLRQEIALKNTDRKSLQKEVQQAQLAKKQYEELSKKFTEQIQNLEKQQSDVETGHGKLASKVLASHFKAEAKDFESEAANWLENRSRYFYALLAVVVVSMLLAVLAAYYPNWVKISSTQVLFVKLALISTLFYAVAFASKNYRTAKNLAFINRHRASVAQTMDDYLATTPDQSTQDHIVQEGTRAMFQHIQVGYSSVHDAGDGTPTELVTNVIKNVSTNQKP